MSLVYIYTASGGRWLESEGQRVKNGRAWGQRSLHNVRGSLLVAGKRLFFGASGKIHSVATSVAHDLKKHCVTHGSCPVRSGDTSVLAVKPERVPRMWKLYQCDHTEVKRGEQKGSQPQA